MEGYANLFSDFISWVSSSNAAAISFGLNIVMFILTIAGILMYFQQKRQYALLFAMMEEFGIQEKLQEKGTVVREKDKELEERVNKRKRELEEAEKELKERIPQEAKRAYYENTIPVIQKQIFDLSQQLNQMTLDLRSLGETAPTNSQHIASILSEEVIKYVSLKSELEQAQSLLAAFSGGTAAVGIILPYPINLLAVPLAIGALSQSLKVYSLWRKQYHFNKGRPNKTLKRDTAKSHRAS